MKLVFPHGEHAQVLLSNGINRIGSAMDCTIVLEQPGILPLHCELHVTGTGANLQVPQGGGEVKVNGRAVTDLMALRNGDQVQFATVQAKFVALEAVKGGAAAAAAGAPAAPQSPAYSPDDDSGATRVRMAIPKYLLRGVSGAVFGKVFPISGPMTIGRAAECDVSVPADEISRRHALVKPTPEGVAVEDLGSSNGTYINGKRVQHGFLNAGDELRLDAIRFILVAPGMDPSAPTKPSAAVTASAATAKSGGMSKWVPIMLAAAAVIVIVTLVLLKG